MYCKQVPKNKLIHVLKEPRHRALSSLVAVSPTNGRQFDFQTWQGSHSAATTVYLYFKEEEETLQSHTV